MAHVLEHRPVGALGRMTVVAGIHVGVLYAIAAGLGIAPVPEVIKTTLVTPTEIVPPDDPPPPEPVVRIQQADPVVPEPVVKIDVPRDVTIGLPPEPPGPPAQRTETGSAETGIPTTAVMQDVRFPLSQPPYPPASTRNGEEGSADLEVYVLPNGRVGDARIMNTTGYERLDLAAINEAKRQWRFKPATRAGEPVAQWYKVRVVFRLTDAKR
jgi:periplasmic protein TonB